MAIMTVRNYLSKLVARYWNVGAVVADDRTIQSAIERQFGAFSGILGRDWSKANKAERDTAVADVKKIVSHLIVAAGALSMAGLPGILVYTPCQVAGGVAIAQIRRPETNWRSPNRWLSIAALLFWGKMGQVTFIQLFGLFGQLVPAPFLGMAVIPFVQKWTSIALNRVDAYFTEHPEPNASENAEAKQDLRDELAPDLQSGGVLHDLANRLARGEKELTEAQDRVLRELVPELSAQAFGLVHLVRGTAGSGKTVVLTRLVPRLLEEFLGSHGREPRVLIYHHNNYLRAMLEAELSRAFMESHVDRAIARSVQCHTLKSLGQLLAGAGHVAGPVGDPRPPGETARSLRTALTITKPVFDVVLVDEGQDVTSEEYDLLLALSTPEPPGGRPTAFVFFDDLQDVHAIGVPVADRIPPGAKRHLLSHSVRSTQVVLDFALNVCLGPRAGPEVCSILEEMVGLSEMLTSGMVTQTSATGCRWLRGRQALVDGEAVPETMHTANNEELVDAIALKIVEVRQALGAVWDGMSTLVVASSNRIVDLLDSAIARAIGREYVQRDSGCGVDPQTKLGTFAVRPGCVSVANLLDVKGYDADIVVIANPDGMGGEEVTKRIRFYTSATRAKQMLLVFNSIPRHAAPIFCDAEWAAEECKRGMHAS